jgi:hypothetical protein
MPQIRLNSRFAFSTEELSTTELYQLERDPGEYRNLADRNPEIVDRLTERLESTRSDILRRNNTLSEKSHVRETISELKAAGRI